MDGSWLRQGPALEELVARRLDGRKGRADVAILIPSYRDNALTASLVDALGRQSFLGFDIIIVYGSGESFIKSPAWASILHMEEKESGGPAGAFFIAQKAALEDGYGFVIMVDNGCVPKSRDVVGELVARASSCGYSLPKIWQRPSKDSRLSNSPNYFGCIRRDALLKAGLTFLPFYYGADDMEFNTRLRQSGFIPEAIGPSVKHGGMKPLVLDSAIRKYYAARGEIESVFLRRLPLNAFLPINAYLFVALIAGLGGRTDLCSMIASGVRDGCGMRFFKNDRIPGQKPLRRVSKKGIPPPLVSSARWRKAIKGTGPDFWLQLDDGRTLVSTASRAAVITLTGLEAALSIGKDVSFGEDANALDLPFLITSRSAYAMDGADAFVIHDGRSVLSSLFRLMLVPVFLPLIIVASAPLTLMGAIMGRMKGVSSEGYGLDGRN